MRRFLWLSMGALLLACAAVASSGGATQAEARWVITDLGTLGGRSSEAVAINEHGQVVGVADTRAKHTDGQPIHHAFRWQAEKMSDLGARPGMPQSAALALNDRGQVVVIAQRTAGAGNAPSRAYLWENGRRRDLGTPSGKSSLALAINERGQVIGCVGKEFFDYPYLDCFAARSFVWERGRRTDLGTLGGRDSEARAVNDRGQIVGWADTKAKDKYGSAIAHAFLWQNGRMRDLGTLGGEDSGAAAINESGQIVGGAATKAIRGLRDYYEDKTQVSRAFVWQHGKMLGLGTFGGPDSGAIAINQGGQLVGSADTTKTAGADRHTPEGESCGDGKYSHPAPHAFLWAKGRIRDLGTLGGLESEAAAINDRGQVVGWADTKRKDPDGCADAHAFVWENGQMIDLGTLPGGRSSEAVAINGRGQIVGWSDTKGGTHAVLWTRRR